MPATARNRNSTKGRRSLSAESRKSLKKKGSYKRLSKEDEIEMMSMGPDTAQDLTLQSALPAMKADTSTLRDHDIYERTKTMPNKELRLMDVPVTSSLFFQMLLFYHRTYDVLYFVLEMGACIHRLQISRFSWDPMHSVSLSCLIIWVFIEIPRLKYGFNGNINELYPEMFAFLIFTCIFTLPLSIAMLDFKGMGKYPHE